MFTNWRKDLGAYIFKNFIQDTLDKYNVRISLLESEKKELEKRIEILETYYKDLKAENRDLEVNLKSDIRVMQQEMNKTFYVAAKLEGAIETIKLLMKDQGTKNLKDGNDE